MITSQENPIKDNFDRLEKRIEELETRIATLDKSLTRMIKYHLQADHKYDFNVNIKRDKGKKSFWTRLFNL